MHGNVMKYMRLKPDKVKYWLGHDGYVFVDHGFFTRKNFLTPTPVGLIVVIHQILYFYGLYHLLSQRLWVSWIIQSIFLTWSILSTTGGAHRLFAHRSYQAGILVRLFYALGFSVGAQHTLSTWAGGHRIHHKYSDTDADPHNSKRGFFFAHIGWIFTPEHPDVATMAHKFDFKDLKEDKILDSQHRYYRLWMIPMSIIIPVLVDQYFTQNTILISFSIVVSVRTITMAHMIGFVNSAAHMFGDRPYQPTISARDKFFVSLATLGEGSHNYHHSYPWDYRGAESSYLNFTLWFIDGCALLGLVTKRKTASQASIDRTKYKAALHNGIETLDLVPDHLLDNNNITRRKSDDAAMRSC